MKRKAIAIMLLILALSLVACQQANKDTTSGKEDSMKKTEASPPAPVETTGNAAVDAVKNDLNKASNEDKELSTDELSNLDSGLTDIENI